MTHLGPNPRGPRARHFRAPASVSPSAKWAREQELGRWRPPGARSRQGPAARAGRMLAGQPARGAAARGSPARGSGGAGPRPAGPGGRGRGGAARVASRTSRCRLLQPSLVELTPPWRARPLHKRPPRWRRRTPTRSDPPREEESAQRHGDSPPRRRQSSPPPLPTLPPLTGNSCGLRATKLAAVSTPP